MSRLIDVDAFICEIRKIYCERCDRRKGFKNGKMRFCYEIGGVPCRACDIEDVLDALDDYAPTVQPEPKRGEWLPTSDDNKKRCSECDVITLIAQYPFGEANFCPNCGAKMERRTDE